MKDSEKYGLGKHYTEVKITGETLYDFLKSIELYHFGFDVFRKEVGKSFLICGIVYEKCDDVETFKNSLMKYKCSDVWKVFKFYSDRCECYYFRIVLEESADN